MEDTKNKTIIEILQENTDELLLNENHPEIAVLDNLTPKEIGDGLEELAIKIFLERHPLEQLK